MTDSLHPPVELVALLASAGGLEPLSIVLSDLPAEFAAAVVVQQHLGGHSSVLPSILGVQTTHRVDWAHDGEVVVPGQVLVCPPGVHMELRPDGSCCLRAMKGAGVRRFDVLLASLAGSYGPRGLAVVLSGCGRDGAEGTVAMKRAGGVVIAQSPDTAEYPSMPIAAARAGADLVLPVREIGQVLADIVAGAPLPQPGEPREGRAATPLETAPKRPARETDRAATAAGGQSRDTGDMTPHRDTLTQPSPNRIANSAGARAETARARAAELGRRRQDLAAGLGATAQSVATARRRAKESLRRAQQAGQTAKPAATRLAE